VDKPLHGQLRGYVESSYGKVLSSALYALSKMIWKDFVIQIKAGILPGEVIIVKHGKLAAYDGDALRVSRIANKRMNHAGSEPLGEDEVFFVRLRVSQSCG